MTVARGRAFEFRIEPLSKQHDREGFSCGVESIDGYLKTQASQDMRRKANAVFVLIEAKAPTVIVGYFTLCAIGMEQGAVPEAARRYIPRYPLVSTTLIGRLAVSRNHQRKGIGALLLARALRIAYENTSIVGSSMIVVDAIDDGAIEFYRSHGFVRLDDSLRLIIPMSVVGKLAKE